MQLAERNREIDNYICITDETIIDVLLRDKTTGQNIIWATDNYVQLGDKFKENAPILSEFVMNDEMIKQRTDKSKTVQENRIRGRAEVFTPAWICNCQNNLIDDAWFGRTGVFNTERYKSWETKSEKIKFDSDGDRTWQDYVSLTCLEPACGEAPYLVSRYDVVTGEVIDIKDRIGRLDRKIRVINENVDLSEKQEWMHWVIKAYKGTYGYELQGDSLFIARRNLLFTFVEYYEDRFGENPGPAELLEISDIIVWNIWQMDGLKFVVPYSCKESVSVVTDLLGNQTASVLRCPGCEKNDVFRHNGVYCEIMNWETNKTERVVDSLSRRP